MIGLCITIVSGNFFLLFCPFKNGLIVGWKQSNRPAPQYAEQIVCDTYGVSDGTWRASWNYLIVQAMILFARNFETIGVAVQLLHELALAGVSVFHLNKNRLNPFRANGSYHNR
jgi:hypothetical protein